MDHYKIKISAQPKTSRSRSKMEREHYAGQHRGRRMTRLYPRLTDPVSGSARQSTRGRMAGMNFVTRADREAVLPQLEVKGGAAPSTRTADGARWTSTQGKARRVSHG